MSQTTEFTPEIKNRKHSAEAINRALARFPLILEILGQLGTAQIPHTGDDDLRHGCERMLTSMLAELSRIEPAPPGKSSKAEDTARSWLKGHETTRLIDADKLQRIQQFVDRILGTTHH